MPKVGIIGGLGPASTLDYYNDIIEGYRKEKNDNQYPELVIESVNMTRMIELLETLDYDGLVQMLLESCNHLKVTGATFAAIASNTPHIVFSKLKEVSPLPLISIVEATCEYAKKLHLKKVLVLGTKFTMSNGLYTNVFPNYGVEAFVPDGEGIEAVHHIIFPKLEDGIVDASDKVKLLSLANQLLTEHQADGLVLGCTELPLMIKEGDLSTTLLNTTKIHVDAIVQKLISE